MRAHTCARTHTQKVSRDNRSVLYTRGTNKGPCFTVELERIVLKGKALVEQHWWKYGKVSSQLVEKNKA